MAAEAERAAAADDRGVGGRQPLRDRSRRPPDQRGLQLRVLSPDVPYFLGAQEVRLGRLQRPRTGPVLRVIEQQAFADGFARAERHETNGAPVHLLLDRDGPTHEYREEGPWGPFDEEHVVGL